MIDPKELMFELQDIISANEEDLNCRNYASLSDRAIGYGEGCIETCEYLLSMFVTREGKAK